MKLVIRIVLAVAVICIVASCTESGGDKAIDIVAKDYRFECADTIPSGWETFRFHNAGHAEHFFLLNRLPDSISFERYHAEVSRPFDIVFDSIKAGMSRDDAINLLVSSLPAWYFESVKTMGGSGIVSKGLTTEVTLNLPPATYVMECYIKEQGVFHTALGMIKPILVTSEESGLKPPKANMELTLTNFQIADKGTVAPGRNTVAVHFAEQPEVGLGNDIHVIRLTDSTNLDSVIHWLDWMNIKGLEAPAPVQFLGGTQEMPVGNTSYFTVNLEKGEYAWIAETAAAKGMIKKFTVY